MLYKQITNSEMMKYSVSESFWQKQALLLFSMSPRLYLMWFFLHNPKKASHSLKFTMSQISLS